MTHGEAVDADLVSRTGRFLASRLGPGEQLCVGYSGGLDSTVLLHVLAGLREALAFRLSAVHVHHGLSVRADDWAEHCRRVCLAAGIPLAIHRVEVTAGRQGLEAAAREARYRAFSAEQADHLVLAHHRDDQAETLLFRLLRGAGTHGLSAMAAASGRVLRPFLDTGRDEIERYARANGLDWIEDDSNADIALTRNWLRHEVFPMMERRFPAARVVLARTAGQLAESAALLDELAALDRASAQVAEGLRLDVLSNLGTPRARNLLRHWIQSETGVSPASAWLDEALRQLLRAAQDRHPGLPVADRVLRRQGSCAVIGRPCDETPAQAWRWSGESELMLGDQGRLRFDAVEGKGLSATAVAGVELVVTWRVGGERLRPDCRRPGRTLKNLLREAGVPAGERGRLPLLFVDGRLAWAPGLGVDCRFQAGPGEPGWLIAWCPPGR